MMMSVALEIVVKSTILLGVGFVLGWGLKRSSASLRASVWAASLVGLLVLPMVVSGGLDWQVLPATASAPLQVVSSEAMARTAPPNTQLPPSAEAPLPTTLAAPTITSPPPATRGFPFSPWMVWLVGALLVLGQLLLGLLVLSRWTRRAQPLTNERARDVLDRSLARADVRREVTLYRSADVAAPMTWGLRKSRIVLPTDSEGWSDERLRLVLDHEVGHVARRDTVLLAIARVAVALHWFNPLAWAAERRLRAEAERAADDHVLASGVTASAYASHLVDIASTLRTRPGLSGAAFMADRKGFEGRVLAILDGRLRRRPERGRGLALAGLVLACVFPLAAAVPVQTEQVESPADAAVTLVQDFIQADLPVAEPEPPVNVTPSERPAEPEDVSTLTAQEAPLDPRSVAALSRALRTDTSVEVRRTAAWALGQIESAEGVPALLDALSDDDDLQVRRTAVWALGQIEHSDAVDGLVTSLGDGDDELRSQAVWALGQIESREAVSPLLPLLRDSSPEVRSQVAWALGQIESRDATDALAAALANDAEPRVRSQAAWALGQIEPSEAPQALLDALDDENESVRSQAAWALSQIGDPNAVDGLVNMLNSADEGTRLGALRALSSIRTQAAIEAIAPLLQDEDERIRAAAARALGGRSWGPSPRPRPQPRPRPRPRGSE